MTSRWMRRTFVRIALLLSPCVSAFHLQCLDPDSMDGNGGAIAGVCAPDTPDCIDTIVVQ